MVLTRFLPRLKPGVSALLTYEMEKMRIEQDARNRANVERQNQEHRLASLEQCIERVRHRQKV